MEGSSFIRHLEQHSDPDQSPSMLTSRPLLSHQHHKQAGLQHCTLRRRWQACLTSPSLSSAPLSLPPRHSTTPTQSDPLQQTQSPLLITRLALEASRHQRQRSAAPLHPRRFFIRPMSQLRAARSASDRSARRASATPTTECWRIRQYLSFLYGLACSLKHLQALWMGMEEMLQSCLPPLFKKRADLHHHLPLLLLVVLFVQFQAKSQSR